MDEINPIKGEVASTVGYLPWKEETLLEIFCARRETCAKRRTVEDVKYTGSWRNEIFVGEVKFIVEEVKSTLQIRDSLCLPHTLVVEEEKEFLKTIR